MSAGLNWGRILLVIAIALAIWRLWRGARRSRGLWAVLAAGGAFWFLSALNAIPVIRTPTIGRYQYPGAIFLLLIAAELLRGTRIDKRLLVAATAVTAAAAISGYIFLHDGYHLRKHQSDLVRAELVAVEIGRGHESGEVGQRPQGPRRPTTQAPTSPPSMRLALRPLSESQLAASREKDRVAADHILAPAERIKLGPLAPADRHARAGARCHTWHGSQSGSAAVALGPGDYTLRGRQLTGSTAQVGVPLEAARFADGASVNLGLLDPKAASALSVPPDNSNRPWRLFRAGRQRDHPLHARQGVLAGTAPRNSVDH